MHRLLPLVALLAALLPAVQAGAAERKPAPSRLTLCRPGPDRPGTSADQRPGGTARCPYDRDTLVQRIGHLIERSLHDPVEAGTVAAAFGLPAMTTSYDSTRKAAYAVTVTGKDDWKLFLAVGEALYPLDEALAPAFEPGPHPRRLIAREKLDVDVRIALFPKPGAKGPAGCITPARLAAFAAAAGWEDRTILSPTHVTDGGPGYPFYAGPDGRHLSFLLDRQAGSVPSPAEMATSCVTSITIGIPGMPPTR
jgi:hypothetical protein